MDSSPQSVRKGINFIFSPNKDKVGETVHIRYVLTDRNVNEPKSATYYFKVTVVAHRFGFIAIAPRDDKDP